VNRRPIRVLLTGAGGQLGRALRQARPEWMELTVLARGQLDITEKDAVAQALAAAKPDWIVNAAAYTAVDQAEQERELAFHINADGAAYVAEAAGKYGSRMIQLSTDYVFDGVSPAPYLPDDRTNPLNVYGASKLAGEERVRDSLKERALILRTAWVYSIDGPSFLTTMLRLLRERDEIRVVEDQIGTPTSVESLAQAVIAAIEKEVTGIHHWTDAGVASWYDFACAIRDEVLALGLLSETARVRPVMTDDYPTAARRPASSVLDKTATRRVLGCEGDHWRSSLHRLLSGVDPERHGTK
jgi:dTDP-4-dehydrorhamnose reductase